MNRYVSKRVGSKRDEPEWVLLHGAPLTPAAWDETADHLTDQPVLVPDCTRVSLVDAQRTLATEVASIVGNRVIDVVGHSFGGQIALELALLRPDQVRTLTLVCSRDTPYPSFASSAATLRSGPVPPSATTLARWFTPDELAENGSAVRHARRDLETAPMAAWAAALDAIATYDRSERTPALTMPVALFAAGGDTVSTPEAMQELANRIPGSRFEVRPEWMHMSPFVDPRGLAELLRHVRDQAAT